MGVGQFSVSVIDCFRQMALQSFAMYCPKCGDVLKEERGVFICDRGQMALSQHMAERPERRLEGIGHAMPVLLFRT